ncbi:MAG: AAA family ATPase [Terriglobales bacterium]
MRKWMSERLKRRKKAGDGSPKEASNAPEPLQPKYYDNEPAAPPEAAVAETRRPSRPEPEPASEPAAASSTGEARPRTSRRRRGRGGRGGSRSRPVAATPAAGAEPSAVEASAAEVSAPEPVVAPQLPAEAAPTQAAPVEAVPVQAAPVPARASKGTVVLAIGLPGSGKSSWFKRHNIHPLSSDLLRELLFDDAQEQRFQDLVFSNLRSMLKARLIARRPMNYVDATNLTPHDRQSWIKLAKDYGYDVQGVFFDVPVEICMERHQRRGRAVPEDVMRKMAGKLKPPTFEEGFSKITVVRVKQKEAAG